MLPIGFGRFMHLVVLYGYQGADADAEQLALTKQLFDAALGEFCVVGRGQPKSLACQKGFRLGSGLILRKLGPWLLVCNLLQHVSEIGALLVVIVGTLWLVALLMLLFFPARFSLTGRLLLILLLGLSLTAVGGLVRLRSRCSALSFGLPPGCLLSIRGRGSKSVEVQRVWEVYGERVQFVWAGCFAPG